MGTQHRLMTHREKSKLSLDFENGFKISQPSVRGLFGLTKRTHHAHFS